MAENITFVTIDLNRKQVNTDILICQMQDICVQLQII